MPIESATESPDASTAASILALAPFPVVVVDADGTVVEANPAAVRTVPGMRIEADFEDCAPSWLADAHASGRSRASGWIGNRRLHGTAGRWPGGRLAWWLAGDGGPEGAAAGSALDPGSTAFLVEASNQLMSSLNVERSLEITATLAARHLAEVAVVVAPPSGRRITITRVARAGAVERQVLRVDPAEVPGLSEALQGFPPVPSRWIDPDTAPDWLVPDGLEELGSLIVTPLPGNGIPAGALILLRGPGQERFTESEEALARVFAARAGAAISAALLFTRQSTLARTLAEDLMPPSLTRIEGVELAGGYRPAGDEQRLGGDFYDFHGPVPADPGVLVVFGDVCGKGVAAAMLAGKIRTSIGALRMVESDHERMLQLLNRALLSSRHTRFATLVLASARRVADSVAVRVTSGGHPPPLVVRTDGSVERTATRGTLIGAVESVRATSSEVLLAPGETCLLYSDGITDAVGGLSGTELYGSERLEAALASCAGLPAEAVVERVQMLAEQWLSSNRRDDMAVVAITAPAAPIAPIAPPVSTAAAGDIRLTGRADGSRGDS